MAEIVGVQIIGILFGVFMIYYTFLNYKRREFRKIEYAFWIVLWTLFLVVTIIPEVLDPIVTGLNFARTLDLFIIIGLLFFTGIAFYMYAITRKNENKIEEIVRKIAFQKSKK